jgi:hypothetical protein
MSYEDPECFGILEQVFPKTGSGLRRSPERCLACSSKTRCLKEAVGGNNQTVMTMEKLDRTYKAGNISFLQRWSQKKLLNDPSAGKNKRTLE